MAIQKTLKLVKDANGDVFLYTTADQFIASFNPSQTIVKEAGDLNRFKIVINPNEAGFPLDYRTIDPALCIPVIIENGINDFLIELSKKFFFLTKTQLGDNNQIFAKKNYINDFVSTLGQQDFVIPIGFTINSVYINRTFLVSGEYTFLNNILTIIEPLEEGTIISTR